MNCFSKALPLLIFSVSGTGATLPNAPTECGGKMVGIEVVGSLGFSSNWASPVPIRNHLFLIDQSGKEIYTWKQANGQITQVFNETDKPDGVNWDFDDFSPEYIQNIAPGLVANEVYVVITSLDLPAGIEDPQQLPILPGVVGTNGVVVDDLYDCSEEVSAAVPFVPVSAVYNHVIYKFTWAGNKLKNPDPIIAFKTQGGGTHKGGALLTLQDGRLLYFTGDSLPFGTDGRAAPQDDESHVSKILLIDPESKDYEVVAKGIRNPQHAEFVDGSEGMIAFMDIGGVTAEEINAVSVEDLLDKSQIENFGWGRNSDGKAREGTSYILPGVAATFGSPPRDETDAPSIPEPNFVQPYAQYGRNFEGVEAFVAITGPVTSTASLDSLQMLFADLPSGTMFGTTSPLGDSVVDVCYVSLVDLSDPSSGTFPSLNHLNRDQRVDPRFFRYPDGTAGVLLEATGTFYRFTEIEM